MQKADCTTSPVRYRIMQFGIYNPIPQKKCSPAELRYASDCYAPFIHRVASPQATCGNHIQEEEINDLNNL